MAKNSIQPGNIMELPAPSGGIKSGEAALINGVFGVAQTDGDEGELTPFAVVGVHELPKNETEATTRGARLYWDVADGNLTTSADTGTNKEVGIAASAEAADAPTVECRLGVLVGA